MDWRWVALGLAVVGIDPLGHKNVFANKEHAAVCKEESGFIGHDATVFLSVERPEIDSILFGRRTRHEVQEVAAIREELGKA